MTRLLFAHPEWMSLLGAGVLGLAVVLLFAGARGRRRLGELIGESGMRASAAFAPALRDGAMWLSLFTIAVALVGPRFGQGTVQLSTSGIDLVILLDVSRSMDARDTPPSRLEAGRRGALAVLTLLSSGDRAAIALFSTSMTIEPPW